MAWQLTSQANGNWLALTNAPTVLSINDYPFTMGGWFRSDEAPGASRAYMEIGTNGSPFREAGMRRVNSGGDRWAARHDGTGGTGDSHTGGATNIFITAGVWRHLVCVFTSRQNVQLYIDGNAAAGGAPTTDIVGFTGWHNLLRVSAGADTSPPAASSRCDCTFAELAIWNVAFTSTNVTNWYNGGTGRAANDALLPAPRAYWTFNYAIGSTAADSIGSNDLTVVNGTTGMTQVTHPVGPFGGGGVVLRHPGLKGGFREMLGGLRG